MWIAIGGSLAMLRGIGEGFLVTMVDDGGILFSKTCEMHAYANDVDIGVINQQLPNTVLMALMNER